ncbi:MAG TPA: right-handed parallel beta-helix repeat-containing protein [Nocardiopsis listeri]|uniref:pectate lyase family protein n=1 Tax=Nocardiopsis listeri TaxID=53440 RepID=UPI001D66F56C|nr:right-handed parallel beta-helix repeat-containing protein [Nocardiopsis listeri]HJE59979.1 right-handed parallel beta-helix repeat-containing protein [Nocardiopsis listeri]
MSIQRKRRPATTVAMAAVGGAALLAGAWFVVPGQQVDGELTSGSDPQTLADPHSDTPVGYAAMNGGTTGGFGGDNVEEYVLSEYASWSEESTPGEALYQLLKDHDDGGDGVVVHVDVTVTADQVDEQKIDVKDVANVSILGVGDSGEFDEIGFKITRSENIVFRNLNIHHVSQGEGDALEVTEQSSNVWIDHNDFSSEKEGVDKDHYDGLVDIKHGSEYVTVSWNRFSDHWKTSLVGHNDSADAGPDLITYHHNHFSNLNTRVPLIRHADVHMLNNVFEDIDGSAINARMGAQVLVEGNHFDNVGSGDTDSHDGQIEGPVGWWYGSSETGYWNLVDNEFTNGTPYEHLESTTDFTVPYDYTAQSPADAKADVEEFAGTGVIDTSS